MHPQLANLACYVVQRDFVLSTRSKSFICRFIDDFFVSGTSPPPEEANDMAYSQTSKDPSDMVYPGVRCRIQGEQLRTTLFDRAEHHPFHNTRFPKWATTAPRSQLGGVLMGRYIACQEACGHMQDFKESIANVVRHAIWRSYPMSLITKVWASFLQKRWQSADIRGRELHNRFRNMPQYLRARAVRPGTPNPRIRQPPIRDPTNPHFQATFGQPTGQAREPTESTGMEP